MTRQVMKQSAMIALVISAAAVAGATNADRITALEKQMADTKAQIAAIKGGQNDLAAVNPVEDRVHFGGYGEVHANFIKNGNSAFDIHRLVMYLGYDFNDWIKLHSETEIEHAFVTDGSDGELAIEQLYVDFLISDAINVRVGRLLAPIGIINEHHEPTQFLGVERPDFTHDLIPTTWFPEGIGLFGAPASWLSYEAYVVGGLDGSEFNGSEGIREGRTEQSSDLGDPAVTGRLDFYPFINRHLPAGQDVRIGLSGYYGGTDNANGGGGNGVDNNFGMYCADFEYLVSRFQFRGVLAQGFNSDAAALNDAFGNDVADQILGWYLEGGVHALPDSWKSGKLAEADVVPFVRFEDYDTQHKVPSNATRSGNNHRKTITIGVNVPLTQQFVVKTDYQFRYDEAGANPDNQFNVGMGWVFD